MDYTYVETPERCAAVLAELRNEPLLAVDTEAAGYHRYRDRLSLVQVSTRGGKNFLFDPFALPNLSEIGSVFADPAVEKVFHDADYDVRILDRDLGVHLAGLFDTQLAAAFVGERQLGLGSVLEKRLGLKLPKEFQRADWAERPIPEPMRDYAVNDTAHLAALRDRLRTELESRGRVAWAEEEFARREAIRWSPPDTSEAWMRVKGARDLPPRGLAILRELWHWRETVAAERDAAAFRVLGNEALISLSVHAPRTAAALGALGGISPVIARRYGPALLAAIHRGLEVPENELPHFPRAKRWERDPDWEDRVERLRAARNRRAEELDLDPGFVIGRNLLEEIARRRPTTAGELLQVPDVRRWQVEATGEALLRALRPR